MTRLLSALLVCAFALAGVDARAQMLGTSTVPSVAVVTLPAALGAPAAVYSVVKLSTWGGSCAQVQRASDSTTLNVGFVNNICDKISADTFCKNTSCGISKWYDQSGNGNDLVQTVAANQPLFVNLNEWLGIRPITVAGVTSSATLWQALQAPVVAGLNRSALSVYHVSANRASLGFNVAYEFTDAAFSTAYMQMYNAGTSLSVNVNFGVNFGLYSRAHINIVSYSGSSAAGQIVRTNLNQQTVNGGSPSSQSLGGFQIGRSLAGNNYNGIQDDYAYVIYSASHTSAQMQSVEAALALSFQPPTTFTNRLVYGGTSLVVGLFASQNQNAVWQGGFGRGTKWETYNMAVGGQTIVTGCTTNLSLLLGLFDSTKGKNVTVLDAPSNDISAQGSFASHAAAVAWADTLYSGTTVPCVSAFLAAGFTKVVVPTVIARGNFNNANFLEDARIEYNLNVVNGATANGYTVSDPASNPFFSSTAATSNTNCYAADAIHLISGGVNCYGIMESYDKAAIGGWLMIRDIKGGNDNFPMFLRKAA